MNLDINLHKDDLPEHLALGDNIAVDCEFTGLNVERDNLCLVQISSGNNDAHIIQLDRETYEAPNLKKILKDKNINKIFHYARFDIGVLHRNLNFMTQNIYCTKIASKIGRTFSQSHGLKNLVKEILSIDISKEQQSSYWGADVLNENQINYAKQDVLYLHKIKQHLDKILKREDRYDIFEKTCRFLPTRCELDNMGWDDVDPFSH